VDVQLAVGQSNQTVLVNSEEADLDSATSEVLRIHRAYRTHRMTPTELKQRLEAGEPVVIVDLGAAFERQEGYIPGALAVAYQDLDSLLPKIGTKEVVFYCSCPDDLTSVRAALRLKSHGLTRVHALLGGFSGWRELGSPVDAPLSRAARA
jgi:rhodanese-related sulfurtransferase